MTIEIRPAARMFEIIDAAKARSGGKITLEAKIGAILAYRQITEYFAPATNNILDAMELHIKEDKMFHTLIAILSPDLLTDPAFESTLKSLKSAMDADLRDIRNHRQAKGGA